MGVDEVGVGKMTDRFFRIGIPHRAWFCTLSPTVLSRNHHFFVFSVGKKVRFDIIDWVWVFNPVMGNFG